ncbi:MAG TPA: DNA repair protein RadC [Patescibacteria group bacterium]|jgi:DNA repair protein RadC|nr:DNA repair protein RadC [Patescibacteria group bacterium]
MPKRRRINQIPVEDRPREKLQRKGASALSDFELLEVMIGSGSSGADVGQIAKQVQKLLQKGTASLSLEALTAVHGISVAIASKILSALELAKRHLVQDSKPLRTINDIVARLDDIRTKQQEYVISLSLDGGHRLIARRTITIGTLDAVLAHPREVFSDAIVDRAASVVVAHNHPSGDVRPSQKDITLTQQLAAAGQLLGVPLRDHIIVTKTEHFSYRQNHML